MAAIRSKVCETNFNELNEVHLVLNYSCSPGIKAFVAITTVLLVNKLKRGHSTQALKSPQVKKYQVLAFDRGETLRFT